MTLPNQPSLEQRVLDLEAAMRGQRATNQTERISVINAAGQVVPLSQLAFGSVSATDAGLVTFTVAANAGPGSQGWLYSGPSVDVYVTSGRLRIDLAAALVSSGNRFSTFMGYRVLGPATSQADLAAAAQYAAPDYTRAIELQHNSSGMDVRGAFGTHDTRTGLPVGWYRVVASYAATYSGYTSAQNGSAENRRLTVAPF